MTSRYLPARTRRALAEQTTCADCGGPGPFERDHECPHGLGGSNEPENMRNRCIPCHRKKTLERDRPMIEKADRVKAKNEGTWIGKRSRPMRSKGFQKHVDENGLKRGSFAAKSLWRKDNGTSTKWPKRKMQSRGWT